MLNHIIKILAAFVILVILYMIGCSKAYFGSLRACEDIPGCIIETPLPIEPTADHGDKKLWVYKYRVNLGLIDVIFVVDNSSSMHEEHTSLAAQFEHFLNDIRYLDYHISIITTDISSSPNNPVRGASYQDGKFISLGGRSFLRNPNIGSYVSDGHIDNFVDGLVRPETIACDSSDKSSGNTPDDDYYFTYGVERSRKSKSSSSVTCPSYDERGIYALNLAIENPNQKSFFRSGAHLMMVVISDEDERSSIRYIADKSREGNNDYQFEYLDYPESLVENVDRQFPLKTFSFHSIVIPPGDRSCYKKQARRSNEGPGSGVGFYGEEYARLSMAKDKSLLKLGNLLRGNIISICDRSYGSQLGKIAIYADATRLALPCAEPERIEFRVDGRKSKLRYNIEGLTLIIRGDQVALKSSLEADIVCEEE